MSRLEKICRIILGCLWCFLAILFIEDIYSAIINPEEYHFGMEMFWNYASQSIYIISGVVILIWAILGAVICFWRKRSKLLNLALVVHLLAYVLYLLLERVLQE